MIELLYAASQAGVSIELIIRGICCLKPGVKGISDTIRVISIVGRFLEHSRVFLFGNGGNPELFLSSADLMGRNLDRRVELMFPIEQPDLLRQIIEEVLETALNDRVRARVLGQDGMYTRLNAPGGDDQMDSQTRILRSRSQPTRTLRVLPRDIP
jgi:polyphosphate kinase